jgi:hypothetical protein
VRVVPRLKAVSLRFDATLTVERLFCRQAFPPAQLNSTYLRNFADVEM